MKNWIVMLAVLMSGCGYVERETFTLATTDGKQIRLTCPVVSANRSPFTYVTDSSCTVEK